MVCEMCVCGMWSEWYVHVVCMWCICGMWWHGGGMVCVSCGGVMCVVYGVYGVRKRKSQYDYPHVQMMVAP